MFVTDPRRRGPAQALAERRADRPPAEPGAFCAALLGLRAYTLPADVDRATWRLALRHFAQRRPPEGEFRRLLERRARTGSGRDRDPGARVAAFLLREWERYGLAQLVGLGSTGGRRPRRGAAGRHRPGANLPRAVQLALRGRGAAGLSPDAREAPGRG